MAQTPMPDHVDGDIFPAADYMALKNNILDLDTRETASTSKNADQDGWINQAETRLDNLEAKTSAATVQSAPGDRGQITTNNTWFVSRQWDGISGDANPPANVQATFVAPPSGKVKITWGSGIQSPSTDRFALVSFQVRSGSTIGSGTIVTAFDTTRVCQSYGVTLEQSFMNFYLQTGLTAGATYNIQLGFYYGPTSGGTAYFNRPKVMVEPVLA